MSDFECMHCWETFSKVEAIFLIKNFISLSTFLTINRLFGLIGNAFLHVEAKAVLKTDDIKSKRFLKLRAGPQCRHNLWESDFFKTFEKHWFDFFTIFFSRMIRNDGIEFFIGFIIKQIMFLFFRTFTYRGFVARGLLDIVEYADLNDVNSHL